MNARRIAAMLGKESREILHDPITLGVALAMPPQIQILLDGTYSAIANLLGGYARAIVAAADPAPPAIEVRTGSGTTPHCAASTT